jgi:hypothetical protein
MFSQTFVNIKYLLLAIFFILPIFVQSDAISWSFGFIFLAIYLVSPRTTFYSYVLIFFLSPFFDPARKTVADTFDNLSTTYEGIINMVFILGFFISFLNENYRQKIINTFKKYKSIKYFTVMVLLLLIEPFLFHSNTMISFKESIKYLGTLLFSVSLFALSEKEDENYFDILILGLISFLIIYSLMTYMGILGYTEAKEYYFTRYVPDALSAVDLSVLICVFIPYTVYKIKSTDLTKMKIFLFFLLAGMIFSILIYVARVSLIALAVGAIFLMIYKKKYLKLSITILILLIVYFSPPVQKLFEISFSTESGTLAERILTVWLPVLNNFSSYFLFGLGGRSFEMFLMSLSGLYMPAHNILLSVLLEYGIIATGLFILYNYFLFKEAMALKTNDLVFYSLLPLLIFCIAAMTSTLQPNLFYKVIYVFYLPIILLRRKEDEDSSSLPLYN